MSSKSLNQDYTIPAMDSLIRDGLDTFGLPTAAAGMLYASADQAMADPKLNGQAHYMRRAFQKMKLDGILCIDAKPTVYLKNFTAPVSRQQINELQKRFWNQGTGTLLVIQDPTRILIFSGLAEPSDSEGEHAALIESLDRIADTLEQHRFVERVASGHYYRTHAKYFNTDNAVDRFLLNNLGVVGDLLCHRNAAERKRVHAFLGRIIFTCYLIDREIIILQDYSFIRRKGVKRLVDLLSDYSPERAKSLLYALFARLRDDFNGSMFDEDLDQEQQSISDDDIVILRRFFQGEQLESRQRTFGFWAYDFSVIPVETISAIYEKFLEEEDAEDKEAKGAFYTPKHLAEMVVDEAVGSCDTLLDKKYLDPACGSGIFLVILFNRLADEWQRRNPRAQIKTKARELLAILTSRLCGVDVNPTACHIACFSLYIAFLDQFHPPTLREFQERTKKFLPKLLAYKSEGYVNTDTPAILEGNFFAPNVPVTDDFDIVLGNPPWVGRNQPSDKEIELWVFGERNPYLADAPKAKAKPTAIFLPQRQIAHAFMWKAPLHLKENGRASFLLPSEVLLNKTDEFQYAWFGRFQIDRVLHLADYRKFLFPEAKRPCLIATYQRLKPEPSTHRLEYAVPKVRRQDPRSGLIPISPEDRKWISLQHLLDESQRLHAAVVWKTHLWGTQRDLGFLGYLLQLGTLGHITGKPSEAKRWRKGKGFQPWYQIGYDEHPETYGEPKPIPGKLSDPFIKAVDDNLQLFLLERDCETLRKRLEMLRAKGKSPRTPEVKLKASLRGFRRSPDKRLFQAPLVLINKGFTKFSFVDFHVFFQDSVTGICGPEHDADLLRFFTVYVKSKLAAYFAFHTSGSWGTERDEVRVHELLRLPFPLPDSPHSNPNAASIVRRVASEIQRVQREVSHLYETADNAVDRKNNYELRHETIESTRRRLVEQLQAELELLVYEYFDLSEEEIALIEDLHRVYEPSATPSTPNAFIPTLQETTEENRLAYSTLLCNTLNEWSRIDQPAGKKQPFHFHAESTRLNRTGMVMVTVRRASENAGCCEVPGNVRLDKAVARIAKSSTQSRGGFAYLRGVIFADRDKIRVFKPDLLGNWTRSSALNDADVIFQAIIQSKRRRK